MSALDKLINAVKNQLANRSHEGTGKSAGGGLLGKITDMLGSRTSASARPDRRNVRPASEDPYGDPADEIKGRSVRPASEDPYGDPADEPRRR